MFSIEFLLCIFMEINSGDFTSIVLLHKCNEISSTKTNLNKNII